MENSTSTPAIKPPTNAEKLNAILAHLQTAAAEIDRNPAYTSIDKISPYRQLCNEARTSMSEIGTASKKAKAARKALQIEINHIESKYKHALLAEVNQIKSAHDELRASIKSKNDELNARNRMNSMCTLALDFHQLIETNSNASQLIIEKARDLLNTDIDENLSEKTKSDLRGAINNLHDVYNVIAAATTDARREHIRSTFTPVRQKFIQQINVLDRRLENTSPGTSAAIDLTRAINAADNLRENLSEETEKYINLEMDLATFQARCKTHMSPDRIEELTKPRGDWSFTRALNQLTQFIDQMLGQYSPGFASFFRVKTTTELKMNDIERVVDRMSAGM